MGEHIPATPSQQPDQPVVEQIPHSGIHHGERPVATFDNTPLKDAVEQRLVNELPDTPAELLVDQKLEKKRRGSVVWISLGAAALLVTAGAVVGVNLAKEHTSANDTPEKDPKATAEPHTTKSAEGGPTFTYKSPHEFDFALTDTPQQLAKTYADFTLAAYAGDLTKQTYDLSLSNDPKWGATAMTMDEFDQAVTEMNVTQLADAQFVAGWENELDLKSRVSVMTSQNVSAVHNLLSSADQHWSFNVTNVDVVSQASGQIVLDVTVLSGLASSDPREQENVEKVNGTHFVDRITFTESPDGSRYLIAHIQPVQ